MFALWVTHDPSTSICAQRRSLGVDPAEEKALQFYAWPDVVKMLQTTATWQIGRWPSSISMADEMLIYFDIFCRYRFIVVRWDDLGWAMGLVRFSESVYILYLYIHSKYDVIFFTVSHYILKCFGSLIQHNYSLFMKHGYLRPSFWRSKVILKRSCETTWMCLGIWAWFCCGFCREWAGGIPRAVSHPRYSFEARIFPRCRFLHTTETPMRCPLRILAVADVTWWGFWSRTCHFMSSSFSLQMEGA